MSPNVAADSRTPPGLRPSPLAFRGARALPLSMHDVNGQALGPLPVWLQGNHLPPSLPSLCLPSAFQVREHPNPPTTLGNIVFSFSAPAV